MEPDQWFRLWLALIAGGFSGVTTLAGGALGYWFARRNERRQRWHDEVAHWTEVLGRAHKLYLSSRPATTDEAGEVSAQMLAILIEEHGARPTPHGSVGDALMSPLVLRIGAAAQLRAVPGPLHPRLAEDLLEELQPPTTMTFFDTMNALDEMILSTLRLATKWADKGGDAAGDQARCRDPNRSGHCRDGRRLLSRRREQQVRPDGQARRLVNTPDGDCRDDRFVPCSHL